MRRAWNALEADPGLKDTEQDLERAVSDHIGRLPFLWLAVPDAPGKDSHRAYIEVNAIGLLSNFGRAPVDPPSPNWLGQWADAPKVRESSLWNVRHVDGSYTPGFLDIFESYVPPPTQSLGSCAVEPREDHARVHRPLLTASPLSHLTRRRMISRRAIWRLDKPRDAVSAASTFDDHSGPDRSTSG